MGCDWSFMPYLTKKEFQSTHPHGVRRRPPRSFATFWKCFNPRTHMGCDTPGCHYAYKTQLFQSTHPHGVRLRGAYNYAAVCCFNPRTHMGCDTARYLASCSAWSFNPRTHMGCDFDKRTKKLKDHRFQSTHPHGVRRLCNYILLIRDLAISICESILGISIK